MIYYIDTPFTILYLQYLENVKKTIEKNITKMLQMFDKRKTKVYNTSYKVMNQYMNIDDKNKRYSYKLRRKLPYKSRLKLKVKMFAIRIKSLLKLPVKRNRKTQRRTNSKKNKFFSFKYILPIFLTILVVVALALMVSVIRAEKAIETEQDIPQKPQKKITVHYGTKIYEVSMRSGTLKDILEKADLEIKPEYDVIPDIYTGIDLFTQAWVIIIEKKTALLTVDMDYEIIENPESDLDDDERIIVTKGEKGEVELTVEQIFKNGILYSQVLIAKKIIKAPIDEVVRVAKN